LARLLVGTALEYAALHADDIVPPPTPAQKELHEEEKPWKGLVLAHAQKRIQKVWERYGFVVDEGMGEWDEEGVVHVGMWRRVEVKPTPKKEVAQGY